jgi:hypothetical protein
LYGLEVRRARLIRASEAGEKVAKGDVSLGAFAGQAAPQRVVWELGRQLLEDLGRSLVERQRVLGLFGLE